jgi:glycolate oxidase iron-sulfur subunit
MTLTLTSLAAEADRCGACGLCLPHCPTYRKTSSEADSPRGRIQLMRAVSQDILPNNDRFKAHIDQCLSCRSCEAACPNSVAYGSLVYATRALHMPKNFRWYRLAKRFIASHGLQQFLSWSIWNLQRLGLQSGLKKLFPAAQFLPTLPRPTSWKPYYPAKLAHGETAKGAVSLFLGCASNTFDQATLKAGVYVLNALGYHVHIPPQICCGSIARQMGDQAESERLVGINQQAFDPSMPILSMASGCGAGLQDYLKTHQVLDISSFLAKCDWQNISLKPLADTVFVHDPCTLRNVQKGQHAVYDLLKKIPQLNVKTLPGNAQCCGGAGTYMLTQGDMAKRLLNDMLIAIQSVQATLLVTSNIGCSLHIAAGLRSQDLNVRVRHPVHLLAEQMGYGID